jgi:hypothetical protein
VGRDARRSAAQQVLTALSARVSSTALVIIARIWRCNMIEAILMVLSRAAPGQEQDYHDWYSNIHIRDAMRFRGSIATQRFSLSDHQAVPYPNLSAWQGLALYEVSDAIRLTQEHFEAINTPRMHIAQAYGGGDDFYYFTRQFVDGSPGDPVGGNVVLQQLAVRPGCEADFHRWYGEAVMAPAVFDKRVRSGALLEYRPIGKMLPQDPIHNFLAVYRLAELSTLERWNGPELLAGSSLIDPTLLETSCWVPITPRLTKDAVLHPTAALLASEEAARARLGDKISHIVTARID